MDYYIAVNMKDHSIDEHSMNARSIMLSGGKYKVAIDHI